jgi:fructose-1-phosphate kinase PfkB-like protein
VIRCVALSPALDITYESVAGGLRAGAINRPQVVHRRAGGKAANVARVVTALGGAATLAGIVAGPSGAWFDQVARNEGLDLDLVDDLDGIDTRLCITVLGDPTPTELYEPSGPVRSEAWWELVAREGAADADWTVVSGSLPPGVTAAGLASLVEAAAVRRPVALDAHGPEVGTALAAGLPVHLLKVNRSEAAALVGLDESTDPEQLCRALAQRSGSPLVVVTCGLDGAVATDETRAVRRVQAGSPGPHPTGSGDAFLAALVLATSRGDDLETALRAAVAAGAANAHAPTAGDVSRLSPSGP